MPDLTVIEELNHPSGVKKLFNSWQKDGGDRETYYMEFLKNQIEGLELKITENTVVVLSGMASSSIGMRELPYAPLPLDQQGKGLVNTIINKEELGHPLLLISGVCTDRDVMRGEEIQWMGLTLGSELSGKICLSFLVHTVSI